MSNVQLYHGDCMEAMAKMKDKEFELAIVDPPYGIFSEKNKTGFIKEMITTQNNKWDVAPNKKYFDELFRVSKNQIIWGMQYFTEYLPSFSQLIIWDKKTGANFFADGEAAFCSIKGTLRIFSHQWCGAFKDSERGEKLLHGCQKPVALYKWLLSRYAKPGDRILDTHLGSGSSAIAADIMGFDFVGYEIDKDYYEAALDRFNRHKQQCVLDFSNDVTRSNVEVTKQSRDVTEVTGFWDDVTAL